MAFPCNFRFVHLSTMLIGGIHKPCRHGRGRGDCQMSTLLHKLYLVKWSPKGEGVKKSKFLFTWFMNDLIRKLNFRNIRLLIKIVQWTLNIVFSFWSIIWFSFLIINYSFSNKIGWLSKLITYTKIKAFLRKCRKFPYK